MPTSFKLNGNTITLDADPTMPLLWAIREEAGLHGTKFGCGMALCGACTVHLDGKAIRSCITPDRKSTRLNSSHCVTSRMPSSA